MGADVIKGPRHVSSAGHGSNVATEDSPLYTKITGTANHEGFAIEGMGTGGYFKASYKEPSRDGTHPRYELQVDLFNSLSIRARALATNFRGGPGEPVVRVIDQISGHAGDGGLSRFYFSANGTVTIGCENPADGTISDIFVAGQETKYNQGIKYQKCGATYRVKDIDGQRTLTVSSGEEIATFDVPTFAGSGPVRINYINSFLSGPRNAFKPGMKPGGIATDPLIQNPVE
jgi:hypothetical protein